ncbi:hypothetical protein VPHD51_0044 [Vibrio phage D51]
MKIIKLFLASKPKRWYNIIIKSKKGRICLFQLTAPRVIPH